MKFIADVMLGRLARKLRLLGHDVLYDRSLDDNAVIRISLEQDRVILTRDTGLARRPLAANHLSIEADDAASQVLQVLSFLDRSSPPERPVPFTRCSQCNSLLVSAVKQNVKDLVPEYVYHCHDEFLQCPGCRRVYWPGSHIEKMKQSPGITVKMAKTTGSRSTQRKDT
jgi:uncharacterized protein with PIN domain